MIHVHPYKTKCTNSVCKLAPMPISASRTRSLTPMVSLEEKGLVKGR